MSVQEHASLIYRTYPAIAAVDTTEPSGLLLSSRSASNIGLLVLLINQHSYVAGQLAILPVCPLAHDRMCANHQHG